MNLITRVRTMDKQLRMMLIATFLLLLPQIGQFIAIADVTKSGRPGALAIFFEFAAIFIVPTSLILTAAIVYGLRRQWRSHIGIMLLGLLNFIIAANIIWFIFRG